MGRISTPSYPSRDITPNEVFILIERLIDEVKLLFPNPNFKLEQAEILVTGKTPNDVYRELWEVSMAFDAILGVRGFTPSDTLARAKEITDVVKFIRESQGLTLDVSVPQTPMGKHPNHALKEVYGLLKQIKDVEQNMVMENLIEIPEIPKRVITPTEVYDATGVVLAELQHIKYHLGLERDFFPYKVEKEKTPEDVIAQIRLSRALMPDFSIKENIRKKPLGSLYKTPNQIFSLAEHLMEHIEYINKNKDIGIELSIDKKRSTKKIDLKDIYEKTLDGLDLLNILRLEQGLGSITIPRNKDYQISTDKVYYLIKRFESEVEILFKEDEHDMEVKKEYHHDLADLYEHQKNYSDIYFLLEKIIITLKSTLSKKDK